MVVLVHLHLCAWSLGEGTSQLTIENKGQRDLSTTLKQGVKGRCPRCNEATIFRSYLKLVEHCPVCDLDYEPFDQGDGPAFFVMFFVGSLATPLALWVRSLWPMPLWAFMVLITILIMGLILALLPPAKGILVALQFRHDAAEGQLEKADEAP